MGAALNSDMSLTEVVSRQAAEQTRHRGRVHVDGCNVIHLSVVVM